VPQSPAQAAKTRERRAQALELHLAGASYAQIADRLGYASRSAAFECVQAALRETQTLDEDTGLLTLARLDAMLTALWPKARRGDVRAVDEVLRIEERRAEVLARLRPQVPADPHKTGLTEFERRLREREGATEA